MTSYFRMMAMSMALPSTFLKVSPEFVFVVRVPMADVG